MEAVETVITTEGIKCQQHGLISGTDCACLKDSSKCGSCSLYIMGKDED